jgi:hypothetical protein
MRLDQAQTGDCHNGEWTTRNSDNMSYTTLALFSLHLPAYNRPSRGLCVIRAMNSHTHELELSG